MNAVYIEIVGEYDVVVCLFFMILVGMVGIVEINWNICIVEVLVISGGVYFFVVVCMDYFVVIGI